MAEIRYKIPILSVRALTAYAKEQSDEVYSYNLTKNETESVIQRGSETYQNENAIFYQAMQQITNHEFTQPQEDTVIDDLYDVLIYLDFDGIFDRNPSVPVNALRQKKAESLFRPEGISLDFGTGSKNYIAFERSASMSRKARLSFVRADIFNLLLLAITMNLPIKNCELSKLYAYNGLMFSSGKRVETDLFGNADNIVIVDNPSVIVKDVPVVTVRDVTGKGSVRKYERIEKTDDIDVTAFDGEGFVSPEFAEEINTKLYGKQNRHSHTSFQIRLPYIKGMIHQVDFKAFFAEYGITQIIDIWGKAHNVNNIKMILTKSQFKCASWLNEDWNFYRDYCLVCRFFNHALYITNVSKELPENEITLNYQFLCTLSVQPEQFRPADLPLGWDHPPQDDERHWLTKATEQKYYSLCSDEEFRLDYFISKARRRFFGRKSKDDHLSAILRANPLFINESIFTKQLDDMAKKLLEDFAIGRLIVSGENRFLSGDLYEMLRSLSPYYVFGDEEKKAKFQMLPDARNTTIFTPGNVYPMEGVHSFTLLRSPHIARNEEVIVTKSTDDSTSIKEKYFSQLTDVVMVNPSGLIAERLGGADYDGDMIKIIADPIINDCVTSHYISTSKDRPLYSHINNLPLLQIPSAEPVKSDFADWYSRFQTVKSTFSARIGQISNAALSRSILAYDESIDEELREKYISDIEMLEILTGLEIDSVKSGIKPNLSKYLNGRSVQRSRFLQYKDIVEKSEGVHLWYEPTFEEQFKEYFADTDWSTVSSNVEKLPYYAMMLKKNTKKAKAKPAKASDLFTFAVEKGWEKKLNPKGLAEVKSIIETYDQCLKRIRAYTRNTGRKKKYNDVARILFMRDQEAEYDADTLYTLFINLPPEKVTEILEAARNEKWQFMNYDCRMRFLIKHLPGEEFSEYYDLLSDFSFGGYRVLTDILIDTDNYNSENSLRKLKFPTDSKEMTELIDAYINKTAGKTYREAVADRCLAIIKSKVRPDFAVKCAVALNKRGFMWDVLWQYVGKYTLKRGGQNDE